jgi:hypothetical protein
MIHLICFAFLGSLASNHRASRFDDQDIDAADSGQEVAQTSVGPRHRKIPEQRLGASVERRLAIATSLLRQGACHEALAYARWAKDENVLMRPDASEDLTWTLEAGIQLFRGGRIIGVYGPLADRSNERSPILAVPGSSGAHWPAFG